MMETRTLPVRLPLDGYDDLLALAGEERRSLSDVVRLALEEYGEKRGRKLRLSVSRGGPRKNAKKE